MSYGLFKDFAGPVATVIASFAAALVSIFFGWKIWKTAETQAKTALDQLRYNLFEKRYAIYEAAKESINIAFEKCDEDIMPDKLEAVLLSFEESRFFFRDDIYQFLHRLRNDIKIFLTKNYYHRKFVAQNSGNTSMEMRGEILKQETELLTLREGLYTTRLMLPQFFAAELKFPQLTGSSTRAQAKGVYHE